MPSKRRRPSVRITHRDGTTIATNAAIVQPTPASIPEPELPELPEQVQPAQPASPVAEGELQPMGFPIHLAHINATVAGRMEDARTLAAMAMTCREWWAAARKAAGYRCARQSLAAETGVAAVARGGTRLVSGSAGSLDIRDLSAAGATNRANGDDENDVDDDGGPDLGSEHTVHSVADLSPFNLVATGDEDCMVKLWDLDSGECTHALEAHRSDVITLAALPGTDLLASGSIGGRLFLWRVAPPSPGFVGRVHVYERSSVSTMVGLSSGLLAVASSDGDIPAGSDGHPGMAPTPHIDLWDCERVRQDPSRADEQVQPGSGYRESKCAIFHDDVRPFDSSSKLLRSTAVGLTEKGRATRGQLYDVVALAALERDRLAVASSDGTIRVWDCAPVVRLVTAARADAQGRVTRPEPPSCTLETADMLTSFRAGSLALDDDGGDNYWGRTPTGCIAALPGDQLAVAVDAGPSIRIHSLCDGALKLTLPFSADISAWGASPPAQSCLSISALPGGLLAVVEAALGRTGPLSEERNGVSEENRCVLTVWRFGAGKA